MRKSQHSKNKTFDYNTINNSNNVIKTDNIICTEEFNASIKKNHKKQMYIIRIDNNNLQKNNLTKTNSNSKKTNNIASPATGKLYNKISITQTSSKEKNNKMRVKKIMPINVSCNLNKMDKNQTHRKNNKSILNNENNNTFNIANQSNKLNKNNVCLSPHQIGNNKFNLKNISSNLSPTNQLFKNIVYFKTNVNHNLNNNIYIKKSIQKDFNFINHKKNNTLMNSYNFNTNINKEITPNISLSKKTNISNNNLINNSTNINNEQRKFSRNKKLNLKANFNYSKKSNLNSKINSTLNSNKANDLNYNLILNNNSKNNINNNGNINISIGKSNINIKDSILHIDKIYIKKENNKRKNSKIQKLYENETYFQPKKTLEMNLVNNLIKVEENLPKKNKEKIKTMDYSANIKGISSNVINVHRNFNLINNKNIKEIKRKMN